MMKKINLFNDWLAERLSIILSIMTTFYIIALLVLLPLIWEHPSNFVAWASYISCSIFQAIALPVLGYTSKKTSDKTDIMMKDMYDMLTKIEHIVEIIETEEGTIENKLEKIEEDFIESEKNK
jgi:hypothetical protein